MLDKFKIGNIEDDEVGTGVTVILAPDGATGGVSVRGKAPATRETDLLKSENSVEKVNAVVLSGGSAFGLEASSGVMDYLYQNGYGYNAGGFRVPIVCGASLYDLEYKKFGYPNKEMGFKASSESKPIEVMSGSIGAGAGATVGKLFGMKCSSKSGLGIALVKVGKVEIGAVVAVNAFGNVYKKDSDELIQGCSKGFISMDMEKLLKLGIETKVDMSGNTTIGCIVTNAKLTKAQCNSLADSTHDAYARCIKPVHTAVDGDCIFVLSSGEVECNLIALQSVCTNLMCNAIELAVKKKGKK